MIRNMTLLPLPRIISRHAHMQCILIESAPNSYNVRLHISVFGFMDNLIMVNTKYIQNGKMVEKEESSKQKNKQQSETSS